MIDRTGIVSRDLAAARRFYAATARSLGLAIIEAQDDSFALGRIADMSTPVLRVRSAAGRTHTEEPETQPTMVSLEVADDYSVRAFYRAALEAGGRQVGYPGPQPMQDGRSYYAARVEDPDGNCIECGWRH
ncbi:MAG: VOC family protein [Hyphomonadaceae bacterium]|nr:VOC family protein [Hyphomonadaceae bacterium]